MKKIIPISLMLAALAITSCGPREEDDIFDKSAAERLNEASAVYSQRLMATPNGWAMQYYPTTENEYPYGSGYLILCRFNADHSVNVSMDNRFSNNKYASDTSLWEIITDNGPVLSFNSYNTCMHAFSNPEDIPFTGNSDDPNDETGQGAKGDYEFIIVDAPEDASYMMLKGKKRGTYNLLTPVEEGVDYADYLADVKTFQHDKFANDTLSFNVIHFGENAYKMTGASDGIPNIFPYDGDAVIDEKFNPFLVTKRMGKYYLRCRDKISLVADRVDQEFEYDPSRDVFQSVNNQDTYIEGDNPARYFASTFEPDGLLLNSNKCWSFSPESDMSEKMKTIFNNLTAGFTAKGMILLGLYVQERSQELQVRVVYRQGKTNKSIYFNYNFQPNDKGVTFNYQGYVGQANQILNLIPDLEQFLTTTLSQQFIASAGVTQFDLRFIKLTSSADADQWIVFELVNKPK